MIHSFKVSATLLAQRIVCLATGSANTVKYPDSITTIPIGITVDTVLDTTGAIPVACAGERAKALFNDTCTVSQLVASDTSGRGIPYTPAVTTTANTLSTGYVGVLIGPTVAATATVAEVLVMPGYAK